uniref:Uncharacterized protein n=1 Tax=Rhizophora mucronata TaxID=61149 RepID=A0A2P2JNY4_RHIMU
MGIKVHYWSQRRRRISKRYQPMRRRRNKQSNKRPTSTISLLKRVALEDSQRTDRNAYY